jgi:hypothetical protein
METLKVFSLVILFSVVYGLMSDDDYHKMIDNSQEIRYNCDTLIGDWHPDVPVKVIEECRKLKREQYAKTY